MPDRLTRFVRKMANNSDDTSLALLLLALLNWRALGITILLTVALETVAPQALGVVSTVIFGYLAVVTALWGYTKVRPDSDDTDATAASGSAGTTTTRGDPNPSNQTTLVRDDKGFVIDGPDEFYYIEDGALFAGGRAVADIYHDSMEIVAVNSNLEATVLGPGLVDGAGDTLVRIEGSDAIDPETGDIVAVANGVSSDLYLGAAALVALRKL